MKFIAIVDLPDDALEISDRWCIDIDGCIRYKIEDDGIWLSFRELQSDLELKPMPGKSQEKYHKFGRERDFSRGYNHALKKILGETE